MYLHGRAARSLSTLGNDFCLLLYLGKLEMDAVGQGKVREFRKLHLPPVIVMPSIVIKAVLETTVYN